jgi:hypothetical protein
MQIGRTHCRCATLLRIKELSVVRGSVPRDVKDKLIQRA